MKTAAILEKLRALRVLVVGDICLDRWCTYDPAEALPSAETGIPRVAVTSVEVTPGAGGTIANNLAALGVGQITVVGVVGRDGFGWELREALAARGIDGSRLVEAPGVQTFTYTKVINGETGEEDLPRLDFIVNRPLAADVEQALIAQLGGEWDAVIVSDQAETNAGGVVTPAVRAAIQGKLVWVDSRARAEHFRGVILKPNEREAEEACLRAFGKVDFARLRELTEAPLLLVTHGGRGARLFTAEGDTWVATRPVEKPVDICGAGDSFTAGAVCALAVTGDRVRAAEFGNQVAAITIMKKGTGTASPEELLRDAHDRD
jgi:rfaE bifunctional protein kinase chain/domain